VFFTLEFENLEAYKVQTKFLVEKNSMGPWGFTHQIGDENGRK
jgi:hypothetical protein